MAHNSLNYFFHENEYAELTGESAAAIEDYCTSYVIRYCNFVLREANGIYSPAQCFNLLETHGDNPSVSEYSVLAILIYENDIQMKNGSAMTFFQQRGGTGLFFNNRVVTSGSVSGTASVELREENGIPGEDGRVGRPGEIRSITTRFTEHIYTTTPITGRYRRHILGTYRRQYCPSARVRRPAQRAAHGRLLNLRCFCHHIRTCWSADLSYSYADARTHCDTNPESTARPIL